MAMIKNLTKKSPDFDWAEFTVSDQDWKKQSPKLLKMMLWQCYLIRNFEEKLLALKNQKLIHGPVHTSIGQEGIAVGSMLALSKKDSVNGTHRAHHQYIAKACSHYLKNDFDPLKTPLPKGFQGSLDIFLSEVMGLSVGCCGGRGGSMHLCNPEIGFLGSNAIVGGGIPLAAGAAFANKLNVNGGVVISYIGDGAINQGVFHETLNLVGLWSLPVIYVIENNLYAVATHSDEATAISDLSLRASSYGMVGRVVDGNNTLAMKLVIDEAKEIIKKRQTSVLIEAKTYRKLHHAGNIDGSAFGYRPSQEEKDWADKDPVFVLEEKLVSLSIITKQELEDINEQTLNIIQNSHDFCMTSISGESKVIPSHIPKAESVSEGLHSDGGEFKDVIFSEPEDFPCTKKMKYVEAISRVTGESMKKDSSVLVIGEDVGHMKGGAYLATKGLFKIYPDRIFDTPISEAGFVGLAGGLAMGGFKPIVELMYPDFALVAADQIFNQVGKLRHMYGGNNVNMPLILRTRVAHGCGYGGQHSMDPTGLFALYSGWKIISPSTPADYIGLFNTALRSLDPVLIVENHDLYDCEDYVPDDNLDYFIEFGKGKTIHEGSDVTVLTFSISVKKVMEAVESLVEEGVSADVIDLRTLNLKDIDYDLIGASFKKTGKMVIVEQAPESLSIGPRIAHECQKRFFDFIDTPITCISGADIPTPVSKWLEAASIPDAEKIKEIIRNSAHSNIL